MVLQTLSSINLPPQFVYYLLYSFKENLALNIYSLHSLVVAIFTHRV